MPDLEYPQLEVLPTNVLLLSMPNASLTRSLSRVYSDRLLTETSWSGSSSQSGTMCAPALAQSKQTVADIFGRRHMTTVVIPGATVGLVGVLAFGAVHAWVIVPIWSQLADGIPMSLLVGVILAWAFDRVALVRGWHTAAHGLQFGVSMFGTLLPATAVHAAMRVVNGVRLDDTTAGMVWLVGLFAMSGLAVGWLLTRLRSGALVFAVAVLVLMVVTAGPLPVAQSPRGFWLSVGIACIVSAAGAGIAALRSTVAGSPRFRPY